MFNLYFAKYTLQRQLEQEKLGASQLQILTAWFYDEKNTLHSTLLPNQRKQLKQTKKAQALWLNSLLPCIYHYHKQQKLAHLYI